ncbi:hypothetical protein NQU96_11850 [Pseudoalteromonas elyakovii]|nr:hypothetical protein [Pseudoalteromonas elyakovii]
MERYSYFSNTQIKNEELRAAFNLCLKKAVELNEPLTILVNNVNLGSSFLTAFLSDKEKNKLKSYKTINKDGINIQLKSPVGLKQYNNYGVVLAIHSSPSAIEKIDNSELTKFVVVIAELNDYTEHLTAWEMEKGVKKLMKA